MSPIHRRVRKFFRVLVFAVPLLFPLLNVVIWAGKPHESQEIIRLNPAQFSDLPLRIRKELEQQECTIPQPYDLHSPSPANVLQAKLAAKGQLDWAVLCSYEGTSTILVFWEGPVQCATKLHPRPDAGYLQGIGGGQKGFSREISTITPEEITALAENFGEDGYPPPEGQHQGLSDAFRGKASEVLYCVNGTWIPVAGAD